MSEESTEKRVERLLGDWFNNHIPVGSPDEDEYEDMRGEIEEIVRDRAIENKRLNDRWEELKAWVHATIQSAHSNMFEGLLHKVEEKMNELEAKEK